MNDNSNSFSFRASAIMSQSEHQMIRRNVTSLDFTGCEQVKAQITANGGSFDVDEKRVSKLFRLRLFAIFTETLTRSIKGHTVLRNSNHPERTASADCGSSAFEFYAARPIIELIKSKHKQLDSSCRKSQTRFAD